MRDIPLPAVSDIYRVEWQLTAIYYIPFSEGVFTSKF